MATLFIHLNALHRDEAEWLYVSDEQGAAAVRHGPLSLAANDAKGSRVVVLLPSADLILTQATVPTRSSQRIAAALPYLLEEQFASDVEDLHFAFGKPDAANKVDVAVIARDCLDDWLQRLQEVAIRPQLMLPDIYALPYEEDTWTFADGADSVLLRTGKNSGFALDRESALDSIRLSLAAAASQPPTRMVYYDFEGEGIDRLDFGDLAPEIERRSLPGRRLALLARHCRPDQAINLLQGDYSRREQLGKLWRPWRASAAIALVCLLLFSALKGTEYVELSRQRGQLSAQIDEIYQRIFPQATGGASKERVESLLLGLGSGDNGANGFLDLLVKIAEPLNTTAKLEITRINYANSVLSLALAIGDLQGLDDLKQRLGKQEGISAEIQSASSRENRVEATIQVKASQS